MKLIVGIGNPGKEYEHTRHNIGFDAIDTYCKKNNIINSKEKFNGLYYETIINNEKVLLLKPLSYVNLSGIVVKKYMDYFKINIDDIFVIVDDLDQKIGSYKLKTNSSSGGHNGLKSIEQNLGSKDYKRLKIGISNDKGIDTKNYVLGKFNNEERKIIDDIILTSTNIIDDFNLLTFNHLMTKYNKKV
ncbi:MAG: aminoacyl-tRNA hydrolase [Bacilli bacterium]|nr:aminoacyl-tRNA hydrolase [Bacilli bacterium]